MKATDNPLSSGYPGEIVGAPAGRARGGEDRPAFAAQQLDPGGDVAGVGRMRLGRQPELGHQEGVPEFYYQLFGNVGLCVRNRPKKSRSSRLACLLQCVSSCAKSQTAGLREENALCDY